MKPCPIWNESEHEARFQHELSLKWKKRVKDRSSSTHDEDDFETRRTHPD
jgi:hypothetical protein